MLISYTPGMMWWEGHFTFVTFLIKPITPIYEKNIRQSEKHQTIWQLKDSLQNIWLVFLKTVSHPKHRKTKKLSQNRGYQETGWLNATGYPEWNSETEKKTFVEKWLKSEWFWSLVNCNVSTLVCQLWQTHHGNVRCQC